MVLAFGVGGAQFGKFGLSGDYYFCAAAEKNNAEKEAKRICQVLLGEVCIEGKDKDFECSYAGWLMLSKSGDNLNPVVYQLHRTTAPKCFTLKIF